MPSRAVCWRRPTAISCAPGRCSTAEQKARLKAINGELSLAAVKFGQNILAENGNYALVLESADLDGIPSNVRDQAREKAEATARRASMSSRCTNPA